MYKYIITFAIGLLIGAIFVGQADAAKSAPNQRVIFLENDYSGYDNLRYRITNLIAKENRDGYKLSGITDYRGFPFIFVFEKVQ